MRNKLKLLLLPFILFSLTACGVSKDNFQSALDNTNKAESLHLNYKIDMSFKSEGVTVDMPIVMDMDIDMKTKLAKAAVSMKFLGMDVTVNEYMDMKNNIIYVESLDETSTWTKQKMESFDTSKMVGNYKNTKKIDETDSEYHYQATVTPEDFKQNLSLLGDTGEDISIDKNVTVDIYVNKKDNYISRIEADIKDALKVTEEVEYTKLKFIMSFSNLDKASVASIDQSIIDNAKEAEE